MDSISQIIPLLLIICPLLMTAILYFGKPENTEHISKLTYLGQVVILLLSFIGAFAMSGEVVQKVFLCFKFVAKEFDLILIYSPKKHMYIAIIAMLVFLIFRPHLAAKNIGTDWKVRSEAGYFALFLAILATFADSLVCSVLFLELADSFWALTVSGTEIFKERGRSFRQAYLILLFASIFILGKIIQADSRAILLWGIFLYLGSVFLYPNKVKSADSAPLFILKGVLCLVVYEKVIQLEPAVARLGLYSILVTIISIFWAFLALVSSDRAKGLQWSIFSIFTYSFMLLGISNLDSVEWIGGNNILITGFMMLGISGLAKSFGYVASNLVRAFFIFLCGIYYFIFLFHSVFTLEKLNGLGTVHLFLLSILVLFNGGAAAKLFIVREKSNEQNRMYRGRFLLEIGCVIISFLYFSLVAVKTAGDASSFSLTLDEVNARFGQLIWVAPFCTFIGLLLGVLLPRIEAIQNMEKLTASKLSTFSYEFQTIWKSAILNSIKKFSSVTTKFGRNTSGVFGKLAQFVEGHDANFFSNTLPRELRAYAQSLSFLFSYFQNGNVWFYNAVALITFLMAALLIVMRVK